MNVIVTGGAGFIGSNLVKALLSLGHCVTVIDNMDGYYSADVKQQNIAPFINDPNFKFISADIRTLELHEKYDCLVHLAAKTGVRDSFKNSEEYNSVNVTGTKNIFKIASKAGIKKIVFASSSSVYGEHFTASFHPTNERVSVDPISPYGLSKLHAEAVCWEKAKELGIPTVCLRFYSVYGNNQRPDLLFSKLKRSVKYGSILPVYGPGETKRDYTHITDVVGAIIKAMEYSADGYEVFNIGSGQPCSINEVIAIFEQVSGVTVQREYKPVQPGDVSYTWADNEKAFNLLGYTPTADLKTEIENFLK